MTPASGGEPAASVEVGPGPDEWPTALSEILAQSYVCEYASLTRDGRPITWAVTPYARARSLEISTGLSYPEKAERARRDPRVALLYSDPAGRVDGDRTVVLVEGRATVWDADLQTNTDRYLQDSLRRTSAMDGIPWWVLRRMGWYFARIWIEITPLRFTWWPGGDLGCDPRRWHADPVPAVPPSDPRPRPTSAVSRTPGSCVAVDAGRSTGRPAQDWRYTADRAERLGDPVVTMVTGDGPLPLRVTGVERTDAGYRIRLPVGFPPADGPVCLTFHHVAAGLNGQENVVMVGEGTAVGGGLEVTVERGLTDWSLAGSSWQRYRSFVAPSRRLRRRLAVEAARRDQPVPVLRRPRP